MSWRDECGVALWRSIGVVVLAGVVLGLGYNFVVLGGPGGNGLAWIGQDRLTRLAEIETVTAGAAGTVASYSSDLDDPLAIPGGGGELPPIPDVGRPVAIELAALKQYVDAGAALVIDARDAEEFAAGHIPGAVQMDYERVVSDPVVLETFDPAGLPLITYCGGGACELSLNLAYELIDAGHGPVAVFMGGLPDWIAAGYSVEPGGAPVPAAKAGG